MIYWILKIHINLLNMIRLILLLQLHIIVCKVPLYIVTTPSHMVLRDCWFVPSLRDDVELHEYSFEQDCPDGKFKTKGWKKTTTKKVEVILQAIVNHWGDWFIYSDVDVQFFGTFVDDLECLLIGYDIVLQKDSPLDRACTGFFACRANEKTLALWQAVLDDMYTSPRSDQGALNRVIANQNVTWQLLPERYFGAGLFTNKYWKPGLLLRLPHDIRMHHANWTLGIRNKIAQLAYVQKEFKRLNGDYIII